ncbi:MAG TPA: LemA family protein [Candidatus Nanoarchaeia archaeon]|nr:LemA family protein [Candidatus Nanoarchaeia archaeon]
MKKIKSSWVILGIIIIILLWTMGSYNGLVSSQETVKQTWSDVETTYQRRLDLIPNLVNTVQGAVEFEQTTQTQIAALRTGAVAAKEAYQQAGTQAEKIQAFQQSDQVLTQFRALNINVENYPELRATENFLSLQDELAGTENRITVARQRYNEAVKNYNVKTRRFPSNIIAGLFGFEQETAFEAQTGAEIAPVVEF